MAQSAQQAISKYFNPIKEALKGSLSDVVKEARVFGGDAAFQLNNSIRGVVSKDKIRFKNEEFDLDLCYVTNRLIAMGLPGTAMEKVYRNDIADVVRFMNTYHQDHYMIFNVQQEKSYDYALFDNKVVYLGWPDHHPPTLALLMQTVQSIASWLSEDPNNVAVVHCLAGRGRTGTAICAYLLQSRAFSTANEALQFFAMRRSTINEGVMVPSQRRYVKYMEQMVNGEIPLAVESKIVKLKSILIRPVPRYGLTGDCTPSVHVLRMGQFPEPIYSNKDGVLRTYSADEPVILIDMNNMPLQGDIIIKFHHEGFLSNIVDVDSLMFRFGFHTSFINSSYVDFLKHDLDAGVGVLTDDRFPDNFCVRVMFSEF